MRAAPVLLGWGALSLAGCAGAETSSAPVPRDPAVSPAIRASARALRTELRSAAGDGSLVVAVVAGGRLVWTDAFGSDPAGARPRPDAAYPLHEFTDLIAAATTVNWMTMATDAELRLREPPPAEEWSCRTLAPLWSGSAEWPLPAVGLLQRVGAGGVRATRGCEGWRASAPELARLGAALVGGDLLGDRGSAWLLEYQPVRTGRTTGPGGAAALLMDRASNMAVAVMTDREGFEAATTAERLAGVIHSRVRAQLSPP